MKTELLTSIFTEQQLGAVKEIITHGSWGSSDIDFGDSGEESDAYGYFTNLGKGKQFSGFMSGVKKAIKKSETKAIKHCSNWWQNGSGDMMFFNLDLLECTATELEEWAANK